MTTPTSYRDRAAEIQQTAAAMHARIRGNTDLTNAAVRSQMATVHTAALADMAKLQQASQQSDGSALAKAENAAWGIDDLAAPGSPNRAAVSMSYRDAQDRADQIDVPAEAVRQLERATQTGDELAARAIAHKAFEATAFLGGGEWAGVIDAYTSTRPQAADALAQIVAVRNAPSALFEALSGTWIVPPPAELAGMRADQIAELASA